MALAVNNMAKEIMISYQALIMAHELCNPFVKATAVNMAQSNIYGLKAILEMKKPDLGSWLSESLDLSRHMPRVKAASPGTIKRLTSCENPAKSNHGCSICIKPKIGEVTAIIARKPKNNPIRTAEILNNSSGPLSEANKAEISVAILVDLFCL